MNGKILKYPQKPQFFKELEELKMTQTSLFLLNHISIFKKIANNLSILTYFHTENLINSYLFNKEIEYNYSSNVIYLVFKKDVKYNNNILYNKKKLTILEVLEEIPETIDYYEDDIAHVFTIKPDNEDFDNHIQLLKKGLYLNMSLLTSVDTVSAFVNKLISKQGLYEIMQAELNVEDIPYPFLKLSKEKETYSIDNAQVIDAKDFQILKQFI
jgi:hypothetical protein